MGTHPIRAGIVSFLTRAGLCITDRTKVPTVYGGFADITRYPVRRGHEDGVMFVSDPSLPFAFTSVTMPEKGLLYFQLKDSRVFSETIFWMCDGGRYSAPFIGRRGERIDVPCRVDALKE